jgi:hypothetical protein
MAIQIDQPTDQSVLFLIFIRPANQLVGRLKRSVILIFYFFESRATCSSLVSVFRVLANIYE